MIEFFFIIVFLSADNHRVEEALELWVHPAALDILLGRHTAALYLLKVQQEGEECLRCPDLVTTFQGHVQVLLLREHLLVLLEHWMRRITLLLLFDYVDVS